MMVPEYVWVYDINRRVYRELTPEEKAVGRIYVTGGPIYREHWRKKKVFGQTRLSWVLENGGKVRKDSRDVAVSDAELDARCYVHDHACKIGDAVDRLKDAALLRAIAAMIGYEGAA